MTSHLTPEESIAALERSLDAARAAHLDACDWCRRELAELDAVLTGVRAADHPAEPSPLFWDHLSARVRAAVEHEAPAGPGWGRVWQPLLGVAAAAVLVAWVVGRGAAPTPAPAGVVADAGAGAEARWEAVMELAAELSVDDVHGAVPSRFGGTVLFDELSADEQAALADLLASEMKGLE